MSLKEERLKLNLTQDQFSKILDMPLRTYQEIEKKNMCRLKTAYSISQIINKSIEEIFFK